MAKLLIYFLLYIHFQAQETFKIDSISIVGNIETDFDVISREINFSRGDIITLEDVIYSQRRIESLNIFNSVQYSILDEAGIKILKYTVVEKLNLFGKLILAFENNDNSKASYGASIFHTNLRGRNEFLALTGQVGYKPGVRITYNNPWIFGDLHLKYNIQFEVFDNANELNPDEKQRDVSIGGAFGKGFSLFYSAYFGIRYLNRDFSKSRYLSPTNKNHENQIVYSLSHNYNDLDYYKFPTSGWSITQSFSFGHLFNHGEFDFHSMSLDVRNYYELTHDFIFANNLNSLNMGGNPPYYNQPILGQNGLIRGNDLFTRTFAFNRTILRNELRYKFLDDYFLTIPIPYFSQYTRDMRTSIFAYVFHDYGILFDDLSAISDPKLTKRGYGYGVSLLFPYVYRMSFEFGFDEHGSQKFVFLLNAFF